MENNIEKRIQKYVDLVNDLAGVVVRCQKDISVLEMRTKTLEDSNATMMMLIVEYVQVNKDTLQYKDLPRTDLQAEKLQSEKDKALVESRDKPWLIAEEIMYSPWCEKHTTFHSCPDSPAIAVGNSYYVEAHKYNPDDPHCAGIYITKPRCTVCRKNKPKDEFTVDAGSKNGYSPCSECIQKLHLPTRIKE